jgi:hypothetical protein
MSRFGKISPNTERQIRKLCGGVIVGPSPKRHKYGAVRTTVGNMTFDSKKEAKRYGELCLLESAGKIKCLTCQPEYRLVVNGINVCSYRADFKYLHGGSEWIVEDVKGVRTPAYLIKRKLMLAVHGITIREI